jgi:hypothetical protein
MEFDTKIVNGSSFHLAGIVPCGGQPLDFGMEWPDFMMPIAPNYTMIEAAIMECAWAGCETIWVCLYEDTAPLVRHRIGDFIQDPVWAWRGMDPQPTAKQRRIPIFYVPVHPKNRFRRDCLSWSVIEGALSAFKVSATISKWIYPNKYWVSFPYGYFDPKLLRQHRPKISSPKNFYTTHNGQTPAQNLHTSFSFGKDEFIRFRRQIRKGTKQFANEVDEQGMPNRKLPISEQYSARWFDLQDVFTELDVTTENSIEVEEFYDIATWQGYRNYLSSELSSRTTRPPDWLIKSKEFGSIGLDRTD